MVGKVVIDVLDHVCRTLDALHVPMALMGGAAVAVWGHLRVTHDVDLLIGVGDTDLGNFIDSLQVSQIRPKRDPPLLTIGRMRIIQCLYEPRDALIDVQIDLLLADCPYQREALARRILGRLAGMKGPVSVMTCEDVVLHKLIAGRILDRADAAALLRENHASLDFDYVTKWAKQLAVTTEFNEAWESALPGEPSPLAPP